MISSIKIQNVLFGYNKDGVSLSVKKGKSRTVTTYNDVYIR
jgi:hypothetical protein